MLNNVSYQNKILVIDIICLTAAYLTAVIFRYIILNPLYTNMTRNYDFYRMFYFFILVTYIVIFMFRKEKVKPIWERSFLENSIQVIKNYFYLLILLVIFLYFIHWSTKVSRTVMALFLIFGVTYDIVARELYRKYHIKRYGKSHKTRRTLLIAEDDETEILCFCLEKYGRDFINKGVHEKIQVIDSISADRLRNTVGGKNNEYDLIHISSRSLKAIEEDELNKLYTNGADITFEPDYNGKPILSEKVIKEGGNAGIQVSSLSKKGNVLGVTFTVTGIAEAARYILDHVAELRGKYICFSNVHTTVTAKEDDKYRKILNNSVFTFPDGNPIAKDLVEQGYWGAERVAGPDAMSEIFRQSAYTDVGHFFYGSTEETLSCLKQKLKEEYPWLKIAGMYSPPFRELTEEEDKEITDKINSSGADIVWIGLGAPKQEKWMFAHKDKIKGVMLGVGAGFDFHAGTVNRAPVFVQQIGFEWLYRLIQDPKRLWKRYFVTNSKYIWYTKIWKR